MRLETQLQAPVWQRLPGLKQASDSLCASVSPPLLGGVVEHLSGSSLLQRPLAPAGTVIGSSCTRVSVGIGEGASGLPQPPDTVPWFMSNCQPQSSFPPGQSRLQWASGEVACPATMFTVLRRHREPDLGRPGWAAPPGPSCVHTHFPETEHGRPPASLSPAAQPPAHGGPSFPQPGTLDGCRMYQSPGSQHWARRRGCKGREKGTCSLQTGSCCPPQPGTLTL